MNDKKDKLLGIVFKNQRILYTTDYLPLLQLKGHTVMFVFFFKLSIWLVFVYIVSYHFEISNLKRVLAKRS